MINFVSPVTRNKKTHTEHVGISLGLTTERKLSDRETPKSLNDLWEEPYLIGAIRQEVSFSMLNSARDSNATAAN